jgi:hypothetical protein
MGLGHIEYRMAQAKVSLALEHSKLLEACKHMAPHFSADECDGMLPQL